MKKKKRKYKNIDLSDMSRKQEKMTTRIMEAYYKRCIRISKAILYNKKGILKQYLGNKKRENIALLGRTTGFYELPIVCLDTFEFFIESNCPMVCKFGNFILYNPEHSSVIKESLEKVTHSKMLLGQIFHSNPFVVINRCRKNNKLPDKAMDFHIKLANKRNEGIL